MQPAVNGAACGTDCTFAVPTHVPLLGWCVLGMKRPNPLVAARSRTYGVLYAAARFPLLRIVNALAQTTARVGPGHSRIGACRATKRVAAAPCLLESSYSGTIRSEGQRRGRHGLFRCGAFEAARLCRSPRGLQISVRRRLIHDSDENRDKYCGGVAPGQQTTPDQCI